MTDRQEATRNALQWAHRASDTAKRYEDIRGNERVGTPQEQDHKRDHAERVGAFRDQACDMALMWARVAAVLPDSVLEQETQVCDDERPTFGFLVPPARCILPTGHRPPHTDLTGSRWQALDTPAEALRQPTPCSDRYTGTKSLTPKYCDRIAGHRGVHSAGDFTWANQDQANAASPTSPSVPAQRKAVEDIELPEPPSTGLCCQQAVVKVAEQLLEHARQAPGLTNLERRCLEDAADFVRAHQPAASAPSDEAQCAARTPHGPHQFTWGPTSPVWRCPGTKDGQP